MDLARSICVFCGSKSGVSPLYVEAAEATGRAIAARGWRLVYGGGRVGLMGAVSDACRLAGGAVTGIIPTFLKRVEISNDAIDDLIVVHSMHTRKQLMFDRSDAFLVLPGGFGTLDETFEMLTWWQLALHRKPVIVVDVAGYWQPFAQLTAHMTAEGFLTPELARSHRFVDGVTAAFDLLDQDLSET